MNKLKRGEVWIVALDPTLGREIRKTRPAVVISNDINNEHSDTVTVIPITSSLPKVYPFEVSVSKGEGGMERDSKAKADQIRTIDKQRLVRCIGFLSTAKIRALEHALSIHLDIQQ